MKIFLFCLAHFLKNSKILFYFLIFYSVMGFLIVEAESRKPTTARGGSRWWMEVCIGGQGVAVGERQ